MITNVPTLIVVTGRPASGKTTLAHTLARAIRCPALCRDELKEGLIHTYHGRATPDDHARLNRHVYDVFFRAIEMLLRDGITLVAEAAFQHRLWAPKLEALQEIAQLRLIVCSLEEGLAEARYIQRDLVDPERERYHSLPRNMTYKDTVYEPPRLAIPTLSVDTADGYNPALEQIVAFTN